MYLKQVSPINTKKNYKTGGKIWLRPEDEKSRRPIQMVPKKTTNEPIRASSAFKTEEQVLTEELLANDSLGG